MPPFNADEISRAIDKSVAEVARQYALALVVGASNASPVGNPSLWKGRAPEGYVGGHFRRNWQVGVRRDPTRRIPGVDPTGAQALAGSVASLRFYRRGIIYVVNNVPYANRIENGWSTQAPEGVIGPAIAVANAATEGSKEI